jgi:carboxypeptidase Taq
MLDSSVGEVHFRTYTNNVLIGTEPSHKLLQPISVEDLHVVVQEECVLAFRANASSEIAKSGVVERVIEPFDRHIRLIPQTLQIAEHRGLFTSVIDHDDVQIHAISTLHEAGHGLYEQGIDFSLDGTPLASGCSSGVHESQSRLWENQIGRSRHFWSHYYPLLQRQFPHQLGTVPLENFYRAVNKVQRSLIRTDADELTYNLHVMIRFDLEMALLEGKLAVKDLPDAWHARYESDLGLRAPSDIDGVLQDVQWFSWQIGGLFQGYTLGNIMSAAFYAAALKAHPEIPQQTACGEFGTLLGWLQDNIYRHGRKFTANELVQRVTGGPLSIDPYIQYLQSKFGELYAL